MKKILFTLTILISISGYSKTNLDSLEAIVNTGKQDTVVCKALHILSGYYLQSDYGKAIKYAKEELVIAQKLNDQKRIARSYAIIGTGYYMQGDYDQALSNYISSVKIYDQTGEKDKQSDLYNSIGNVYSSLNQFDKALEYYKKALDIAQQGNDKQKISTATISLATCYDQKKDKKNAEKYYLKALHILENSDLKLELATVYGNIGLFYFYNHDNGKALSYSEKSLLIQQEIKNKNGIGITYDNIGDIYASQKQYSKALDYYNKSLSIAKQLNYKELMQACYKSMFDIYESMNNTFLALQYHKLLMDVKDSLFTQQSNKQIADMNTKYETEKKDKQILQKENELVKQETEAQQQLVQKKIFIAGLILVIFIAVFIFNGYKQKHKSNRELGLKNTKLESAYKLIEEKKKEITDSINYALRIQQAILPSVDEIKKSLDSFVFFKPKDIVSGDFYFYEYANDKKYIAVADCTGHGVPGALMSMIGTEKLKDSIKCDHTGTVLSCLNQCIKDSLHQSADDNSTKDGMDIALCAIDTPTKRIFYSGANRPLWIVRKGAKEIEEIKGDKTAIGGYTASNHAFDMHTIQMNPGDCAYIFSDGYVDQFGGYKGKKFTSAKLKEILIRINSLDMNEQKEYIEYQMKTWIGENEQIDDMLVIGFKM